MKPGRDLDALIAEKVMGFTRKKLCELGEDFSAMRYSSEIDVWFHGSERITLPGYSTDISAAWEVVEKLREKEIYLLIKSNNDGYTVQNHDDGVVFRGWRIDEYNPEWWTEKTAPHAICLAALKAVEK